MFFVEVRGAVSVVIILADKDTKVNVILVILSVNKGSCFDLFCPRSAAPTSSQHHPWVYV